MKIMVSDIDNITPFNNIIWHDIDEMNHTKELFKNEPAIYIFKKICNKTRYYIGSTIKLYSRLSTHRFAFRNIEVYKNKGCPRLYKSIQKYGLKIFRIGILEYIDLSNITDNKQKKKILLKREQYYLDNINPSLNVCKIAGSCLGVKRDISLLGI